MSGKVGLKYVLSTTVPSFQGNALKLPNIVLDPIFPLYYYYYYFSLRLNSCFSYSIPCKMRETRSPKPKGWDGDDPSYIPFDISPHPRGHKQWHALTVTSASPAFV